MPQSLTKFLMHLIFSTKKRNNYLDNLICDELYPYISKIMQNMDCHVISIGGTQNHIHILCKLPKSFDITKMIQKIKTSSSAWIKSKDHKYKDFYWQNGYGAFSVSPSLENIVEKYIVNQIEHHRVRTFEEELKLFLKKSNIHYDENYLLD